MSWTLFDFANSSYSAVIAAVVFPVYYVNVIVGNETGRGDLCEVDPVLVSVEEVVNYADKRVMHDRIVTLEERFGELKDRYGRDQKGKDYLERMEKVIQEIESKIFLLLQMDPDDLQGLQGR